MKNKSFFSKLSFKSKKLMSRDNDPKINEDTAYQKSMTDFQSNLTENKADVKCPVASPMDINKIPMKPKILTEDEEDCLINVLKKNEEKNEKLERLFLLPAEESIKIFLNHERLLSMIKKVNYFFKSKQIEGNDDIFQLIIDINLILKEIIEPMIQLTEENKKIVQNTLFYILNCFQNDLDDRESQSIQKRNDKDESHYVEMKGSINPNELFSFRAKGSSHGFPPPLPHRNIP
ncbi:hypothetical protein [Rickettsiella grylli]|uniref:Uncharacterized protein n=1 Tax=Rickettsiella grylli TaxID=59196 RepID=A8PLQ8_9COXI|nr:hypothetical protein [Rickettsiella grylli]EDP46047.1 hypothetical protein RICGR_0504 [Rickettsiella grylli]